MQNDGQSPEGGEDQEGFWERIRAAAEMPVPVAPYWEGRSFPTALEAPMPHDAAGAQGHYDSLLTLVRTDAREEVVRASLQQLAKVVGASRSWQRTDKLLRAILAATLAPRNPPVQDVLAGFCCAFLGEVSDATARRVLLPTLRAATDGLSSAEPHEIKAAEILFGGYGDTWAAAGALLLAALGDEEHPYVRAAAAYRLSHFPWKRSSRRDPAIPRMAELRQIIRERELARPGVAAAFGNYPEGDEGREWLLDLLCNAPGPEPWIPFYPCNLAFDAHERFSDDPEAVRRLMDAGRHRLAVAAATDASRVIPGMEPLLMELGEHDDLETARLASWSLAYHYRRLHPRGEALGFVSHTELPDGLDLFLVYSHGQLTAPQTPYAVVLYAPAGVPLSRTVANAWVDRLFPESVRGAARPHDPFSDPDHPWYQRGFVNFVLSEGGEGVERIDIGYRSSAPWNLSLDVC